MILDKIRGHDDIVSKFRNMIIEEEFEGVHLFTGPKGVGKYTIAKQLSRHIICSGVKDTTCRCNSCKMFPDTPDFLQIGLPDDETIKVKDIDVIDSFVELSPFNGCKKVLIIDDADRMNKHVSNKILKTLEDIPDHVVMFLISSNTDKIISTVRSRSRETVFSPLYFSDVVTILKENGFKSPRFDEFERALPMLNESLLSNFSSYNSQLNVVYDFLDNFGEKDEDDLISFINDMDPYMDLPFFIDVLLIYLMDILRIHLDDHRIIFHKSKPDLINRLTYQWSRDITVVAIERLKTVIKDKKMGIYLKTKNRMITFVGWVYALMQQEKKKNDRQDNR